MKKKQTFIQQKAKVISIAGAYPRSGCTHMSVSLACFLTERSLKVAVIEYNDSGDLSEMAKAYGLPVSDDGVFVFHDCHYYIYDDAFMSVINGGYDVVIVDYGAIEEVTKEMYYFGDVCILTATASPWELSVFKDVVYQEEEYGRNRILYAFQLADQKTDVQKRLRKELDFTEQIFFVPYQKDMADTEALKGIEPFIGIAGEEESKKIPFWKQFIYKSHTGKTEMAEIKNAEPESIKTEVADMELEVTAAEILPETEEIQTDLINEPETTTENTLPTEQILIEKTQEEVPEMQEEAEPESEVGILQEADKCSEPILEKNTKIPEEPEEINTDNDIPEEEIGLTSENISLFIEPVTKVKEQVVSYVEDKQANYKAKSEMCYIHKTFRLQDVNETYVKPFKIVAFPLEYHPQRPVRMILGVFYNNEVTVLSSPDDKVSVTFCADDEEILFNGQFKEEKFDVSILSLKDGREIRQVKTIKESQFCGLPETFPKYTGLKTDIKDHQLIFYPLYTHNSSQGNCAFMYEITYPDHSKMYGSSEENFEALIPIASKLHTVSCRWLRLGTEAHFTVQLLE